MSPRIACLVPSLTLLLVQLGLRPWMVARSGFCIHPAGDLRGLPKVGGTKDVQLARLLALAPTHVLVNVDENRQETAQALQDAGVELLVTHPCRPDDQPALLEQLLQAFGGLPGVAAAALHQRGRFERARRRLAPERWPARRVLCLIWREPWMTVARDTYISQLLSLAGLQTWPAHEGGQHGSGRYPVVRGDEPWLDGLDAVLLPSEPYRFEPAHHAEVQALCPQARVLAVDGEALSWHGGMAVEGLHLVETLAQRLSEAS
jgi:ABC-type Fe3+-hydroxamate transport system substrate-binding protein